MKKNIEHEEIKRTIDETRQTEPKEQLHSTTINTNVSLTLII